MADDQGPRQTPVKQMTGKKLGGRSPQEIVAALFLANKFDNNNPNHVTLLKQATNPPGSTEGDDADPGSGSPPPDVLPGSLNRVDTPQSYDYNSSDQAVSRPQASQRSQSSQSPQEPQVPQVMGNTYGSVHVTGNGRALRGNVFGSGVNQADMRRQTYSDAYVDSEANLADGDHDVQGAESFFSRRSAPSPSQHPTEDSDQFQGDGPSRQASGCA